MRPPTLTENISSVSDGEDQREEFDVGSVRNSSRNSIQIIPKVTVDSLNVEIKVKRSAALPNNPWLSLPVDVLEKSYTVIITQNPTPQKRDLRDPSDPRANAESNGSRDQRTQTEVLSSTQTEVLSSTQTEVLSSTQTEVLSSTQTEVLSSTQTEVLSSTQMEVLSSTQTEVLSSTQTEVFEQHAGQSATEQRLDAPLTERSGGSGAQYHLQHPLQHHH